MMDIKEEILKPVIERVKLKKDSLRDLKRFKNLGIEGWLKVEAIAILNEKIEKIQNNGPDLLMRDGTQIELKAATDCNPSYILGGAIKYNAPCLFLADGSNEEQIAKLKSNEKLQIKCETFNDGNTNWVIGIIEPTI